MPSTREPSASQVPGTGKRTPVKAAGASFADAVGSLRLLHLRLRCSPDLPAHLLPRRRRQRADHATEAIPNAIARPIGAVVLGHFGDRIGRQKVLMFTLVLMGASTFVVGCLPTFDQVGWLAPILLVIARLCQGLSAAGEQAGASSMSLEHAPDHRRSFFTSWTLTGTQGGQILAAMIFIPVVALPDEIKFGIGWRIPFWLSAVVVVVTFFIRRSLHETPEFEEAKKNNDIAKLPLAVLLKFHWKDVLRVVLCAFIAAVSTVYGTLAISYGKEHIGNMDASITPGLLLQAISALCLPNPCSANLQMPSAASQSSSTEQSLPQSLCRSTCAAWKRTIRSCSSLFLWRSSPALTQRPMPSGLASTPRCSPPRCASRDWRSAPNSDSSWLGLLRPSWPPWAV